MAGCPKKGWNVAWEAPHWMRSPRFAEMDAVERIVDRLWNAETHHRNTPQKHLPIIHCVGISTRWLRMIWSASYPTVVPWSFPSHVWLPEGIWFHINLPGTAKGKDMASSPLKSLRRRENWWDINHLYWLALNKIVDRDIWHNSCSGHLTHNCWMYCGVA